MSKMVREILVTYLCWGCGSTVGRYEESDEQIASKDAWNLCLDCITTSGVSAGRSGPASPALGKKHVSRAPAVTGSKLL